MKQEATVEVTPVNYFLYLAQKWCAWLYLFLVLLKNYGLELTATPATWDQTLEPRQ